KTSLNCTMPELVNSRVGSSAGTSELDVTRVWPLASKNCRKPWRMSAVVRACALPWGLTFVVADVMTGMPEFGYLDTGLASLPETAAQSTIRQSLQWKCCARKRRLQAHWPGTASVQESPG